MSVGSERARLASAVRRSVDGRDGATVEARPAARVRIACRRWTGDREALEHEPHTALVVEHVFVDGACVEDLHFAETPRALPVEDRPQVTLEADGFLTVAITNPPAALVELFADPATHLVGSDTHRLLLPVGELEIETYRPRVRAAA